MSEVQTPTAPRRSIKKTLLSILIGLLVLIAVFAGYVSMQPEDFVVTRASVIPASPDRVFAIVNNFHEWEAWSPWAKLDPNSKTTFSGPDAGVGAGFAWAGNDQVGEGKMTITESHPAELIKLDLEFIKPFAGKSVTEFKFLPEGEGTRTTWTMSGKNGFIGKLFGLMMDCDKMIGTNFEQGFENMKKVLASKPDSQEPQ